MTADRRQFLQATATAFAALAAAGCTARGAGGLAGAVPPRDGYGAPLPDPAGLMDLPQGFSYRVISSLGDAMTDGGTVPDAADGMGCFNIGNGELALVRNHELMPDKDGGGAVGAAYDTRARSLIPLPGGTTTVVLDARTLAVKRQFRSLSGTIRISHDPQTGQLRSWHFDDNGGHGQSLWIRDGNRWVLDAVGVQPDGTETAAVNVLVRINNDAFTWRSLDRVAGDEALPDTPPVKLTRVAASK